MTGNQLKRFERWQRRLPETTAYFVALVIDEVVPIFQARGFDRFPDYAADNKSKVGANCIPLQRRSGSEWPTVEILFDKRGRPSLGVTFAMLPDICRRYAEDKSVDILRIEANVVEGPVFFSLCKGGGHNFDCNFGYRWFSLCPKQKLRTEIEALKSLLPWLFNVLENGIPQSWLEGQPGYVDRHAFLSRASYVFNRSQSV